jgi:hypothetical protein
MKMLVCALLAGVMVLLCPISDARADGTAEENAAAAVFRTMERDVERCFAQVNGNAFVMVEALLDDRGRVRRVETTGDARAGLATRRCVERRVARALFPMPRGGGTSRVRTSFAFARD